MAEMEMVNGPRRIESPRLKHRLYYSPVSKRWVVEIRQFLGYVGGVSFEYHNWDDAIQMLNLALRIKYGATHRL